MSFPEITQEIVDELKANQDDCNARAALSTLRMAMRDGYWTNPTLGIYSAAYAEFRKKKDKAK